MHRLLIPLSVAATVFALVSTSALAQDHDHGAAMAGCACCQKSGTAAENRAEGSGCCAGMAAAGHAGVAADHSAMNHEAPATDQTAARTAEPGCCGNVAAQHEASAGCCDHMNHTAATESRPSAAPFAMTSGTAGCSTDAAAMKHDAGSCCADIKHDADAKAGSCCQHKETKKSD